MSRVLDVAARLSQPARMRYAGDVFLRGHGRTRDRLVAAAYFTLSTSVWGDFAVKDGHLSSFAAGVDALVQRGLSPRRVVDVGTGAGASAALLAQQWPSADVEGIDSSRRMVRHARSLHRAPNLRFRRASALHMPYATGSLDLVTQLNAIVVPSELARVCKPGAFVLAAGTWVGLRDADSDWVRRFGASGFERVAAANCGSGSWELFRFTGEVQ